MRALVALLLTAALPGCFWIELATAPTPCDEIVGAHVCSMVPERYTCECDGPVVAAKDDPRKSPCGHVLTYCEGKVLSRRKVADNELILP